MYRKAKNHFRTYRSPIRWGFIALLLASSLFCWEIALSCYSLYLSLVGGGVVVGITWLDSFFFVLFIIFAVAGVGGVVLMFFIIIMWCKERDVGEIQISQGLQDIKEGIISIERGVNEIKQKLRVAKGQKNGKAK